MPRRNVFDHLPPVEKMAAQILDRLYYLGSECSKHDLARRMSAHKKRLWKDAFDLLVRQGHIRLTEMGSRRQVLVTLVDIPKRLQPRPIITRKRFRRRRPPTEWFKAHLQEFRERDGYGDAPDLDSLPGPGDNNPQPWPAPEPFRPEPPAINLAEPPGWRNRSHDDEESF